MLLGFETDKIFMIYPASKNYSHYSHYCFKVKVRTNATNGKFWFNFDPTCFLFYFIFFKLFSARAWFQRGKQIFENFKADPTLKQSMSMMIYISKPYIHYISI